MYTSRKRTPSGPRPDVRLRQVSAYEIETTELFKHDSFNNDINMTILLTVIIAKIYSKNPTLKPLCP